MKNIYLSNKYFRNFQASRADNSSLHGRKMARDIFTSLYAFTLYRPKGLSADIKATSVFGAGVSGWGLLKFPRNRTYKTTGNYSQLTIAFQIEGLETIRSFRWSSAVIQENILSVNNSQRPEFLLLCLQRWLNIVLDLFTAAVATSVITTALVFREHVSGAQVGIALNIMLVANTTLLKLVESWNTLETSLGAIARVKTLEETTPVEGTKAEGLEPPENWPSRGNIEFKNISASYQYVY